MDARDAAAHHTKTIMLRGCLTQLLYRVEHIQRSHATLLIGIDGCGGAGKSTFAAELKESRPDVTIVAMDDFYFSSSQRPVRKVSLERIGAEFDWKRLYRQVVEPLGQDCMGHYQRYDWSSDRLAEWHTVPVGGVVVIEGVYATRTELAQFYDYKVWIECPREVRLARGLARDGEGARHKWENEWMPAEDYYVAVYNPAGNADFVIK